MGWRTTLGVTLAALAVAGCLGGPSPSPSLEPGAAVWEAEVPSPVGAGVPVTLTDFTGLVTGIGDGDRVDQEISSDWMALSPTANEDPGIAVTLIGSPCEQAFDVSVRTVGHYVIVSWKPSPRPGCDAMAVTYELRIELSQAIDASRLIAHDRSGRLSWGFLVPGSDGLSRPVKVLDERNELLLASPLDLPSLPGVTRDLGLQRPLGREDMILLAWASEACHEEMIVTAFPGRAAALEVALYDTDASGCGGPKHLQGVALTFRPGVDTTGIEAVMVENR